MEYRSAGEYVIDRWRAQLGHDDAARTARAVPPHRRPPDHRRQPRAAPRADHGAAGLNWVDQARPLVSALGPRNLPSGSWSRPRVTQHTQVGAQSSGEKTELASRKMLIEKVPVAAETYGGYVNVSRQDIDWTQPGIMDIIINDLAGQYAIQTEDATAVALEAAATAGATGLGTTPTAAEVSAGVLGRGRGRLHRHRRQRPGDRCRGPEHARPDRAAVRPRQPAERPVAPGSPPATSAAAPSGPFSGIPIYVSSQITAGVGLILSTAAAEVYEDRGGPLQVVEPSVLGVQVAYYGYFTPLVMSATGIIKITRA